MDMQSGLAKLGQKDFDIDFVLAFDGAEVVEELSIIESTRKYDTRIVQIEF